MIVPYPTFVTATGLILESGAIQEHLLHIMEQAGRSVILERSIPPSQFYDLNLRAVQDKTECPAPTIGIVGLTVTFDPVPRPCQVIIGMTTATVSDGSAEIVFGGAGTYKVTIQSVKHLDWVGEVTV